MMNDLLEVHAAFTRALHVTHARVSVALVAIVTPSEYDSSCIAALI